MLSLALAGCSKYQSGAADTGPVPGMYVVAIDRSDSTRPVRVDQLSALDLVATQCLANDAPLDLWAFDTTAVRIWGPRPLSSRSDLLAVKAHELSPSDRHPRRVTRPALLIHELASDPEIDQAANVTFIILTDGDSEVYGDNPLFVKSCKALGALPGARICAIGINPENRKTWDRALRAGFANRCSVAGPTEMAGALHEVLR